MKRLLFIALLFTTRLAFAGDIDTLKMEGLETRPKFNMAPQAIIVTNSKAGQQQAVNYMTQLNLLQRIMDCR
jgi:hypothetical protein